MIVSEGRWVQSGPARIYYELHGPPDGPPILFVPGGNETHIQYYRNVPHFALAGYRVILTSLRGHYLSPCPAAHALHRYYADDFLAILDAERIERAAIKACSLGGFGGMRFAVFHADRTHSLCLTGSTAGLDSDQNYANNEHALQQYLAILGQGRSSQPDYSAGPDALLDRYLCMLGSEDGIASIPAATLLGMHDRTAWLKPSQMRGYRVPTLFIGGDLDTFLPAGFQRHTVTLVPGGELSEFMGSGHRPFWSDPVRFNSVYDAWLRARGWAPRS